MSVYRQAFEQSWTAYYVNVHITTSVLFNYGSIKSSIVCKYDDAVAL